MDVFDLVAKIRLDSSENEDGLGNAKSKLSTLASGVKNGLATVAKIGTAAVAAGVAGVAALTKMGVEGYAQYEQLTGGVETLFKTSSDTVMKYAENAYKTAGMSANEYMETVTSFSASLIQSLDGDTAKAAEVGNMAITDMSDNANKMGTSMEMIQNAYNGFAKSNFTMLDNLKLGYGGTKEEMQRLIDDANKVKEANGEMADLSIDSFADVTEAIHIIQTEMGITGTTAREAATTIEGSISMMKGAWQNLVVGMADENANMDVLINNFVESTATAAENLLPRIEQTLLGIGTLIEKLAPVIGEAVPRVVATVLPTLLSAGISLIEALVSGLITAAPGIYQALLDAIYMALTQVFGMSEEAANGFLGTIDGIVRDVVAFFQAAFEAVSKLFSWLVGQAQTEGTYFNTVWENIKIYVTAVIDVIRGIIQTFTAVLQGDWSGAWENVKGIFETVWNAIKNFISNTLGYIFSDVFEVVESIRTAISEKFTAVKENLSEIWNSIKESLSATWESITSAISNAISFIVDFIKGFWNDITVSFEEGGGGISGIVGVFCDTISNIIRNVMTFIGNLIGVDLSAIADKVVNFVQNVRNKIQDFIGNVKETISNGMENVKNAMSNAWETVKSTVSNAINSVKSAISTGMDNAKSAVFGVLDGIKTKFTNIWDNCKNIVKNAVTALKNALKFNWELPKLKLPHISVSGGVAPYGIGGKGSLPRFSIEWYKKAYDNAMVLRNPTIFGYSSGKFLGGGDGNGNEIVAGESHLLNLIGGVVEAKTVEQNKRIVALLSDLLEATVDGNGEMVRALNAGQIITLNEREFGRAVRNFA